MLISIYSKALYGHLTKEAIRSRSRWPSAIDYLSFMADAIGMVQSENSGVGEALNTAAAVIGCTSTSAVILPITPSYILLINMWNSTPVWYPLHLVVLPNAGQQMFSVPYYSSNGALAQSTIYVVFNGNSITIRSALNGTMYATVCCYK